MSGKAIGPEAVRGRIEAIEEAYEYFLAYAAQGRTTDDPSLPVRSFLAKAEAALDGLGVLVHAQVEAGVLGPAETGAAFAEILAQDVQRALVLVRLIQGQPAIGSQLIDNLNASLHIRTLLTDLFVLDAALEARSRG
jgi:hypothetical protein